MDPIQKALQKARQASERGGVAHKPFSGGINGAASALDGRTKSPHVAKRACKPWVPNPETTKYYPVSETVLERNRLVAARAKDPMADSFRILRAQVLQHLGRIKGTSLGICSATAGEGKTLTCANLGISLSLGGKRPILLVDFDLRRPCLGSVFEIPVEVGLCDYLEGNAELADCLVTPGIDRLFMLPTRRPLLNSSEILASDKISSLMAKIARIRDDLDGLLVIYDLPPLLASDDAMVVLPWIDASLFVVEEGKTTAGEVQRGLDLLGEHSLVGTLLNRSKETNLYPYY